MEVRKGEALLFISRVLTHNAVDIQGGVRHILDAFVHQNVLLWKDRKHQELTGYGREGPPGKKRKVEKGKEKAPQTEEGAASEDPEGPEGMDGEDIEWEEEHLYPIGTEEVAGDEDSDSD